MRRYYFCLALKLCCVMFIMSAIQFFPLNQSAQALTASFGPPYRGRLENGVPFPTQFSGYRLREQDRTYATPELVGAILDAVDAVQKQFPDAPDLYIGDFSNPSGGPMNNHRSHQNGRDVDLGMYVKGDRALTSFMAMNEENLDVPKTWALVEGLLRSQRIQYIFVDRIVQRPLYDYAASRGVDIEYLNRVFGCAGGKVIKHIGGHQDHIHVRIFSPWSTLASKVGEGESQKRAIIEMAQQAYMPKKVLYYAKGTERNLDSLARSFGVCREDLYRWNGLSDSEALTQGNCLVFYKRGFEIEPVHLAQSLQADFFAPLPPVQVASLRAGREDSDIRASVLDSAEREKQPDASAPSVVAAHSSRRVDARESDVKEKQSEPPAASSQTIYSARRGDTIQKIAKKSGVSVGALCELNDLKKNSKLYSGQKIKVDSTESPIAKTNIDKIVQTTGRAADLIKSKQQSTVLRFYTAEKGDTLQKVAKLSGLDLDALCKLNGLKKNEALKPGRQIKLAMVDSGSKTASDVTTATAASESGSKGSSRTVSSSKKESKAAKATGKDSKANASKIALTSKKASAADSKAHQTAKIKIATADTPKASSSKGGTSKVKNATLSSSKSEAPAKSAKSGQTAQINTKQKKKAAK